MFCFWAKRASTHIHKKKKEKGGKKKGAAIIHSSRRQARGKKKKVIYRSVTWNTQDKRLKINKIKGKKTHDAYFFMCWGGWNPKQPNFASAQGCVFLFFLSLSLSFFFFWLDVVLTLERSQSDRNNGMYCQPRLVHTDVTGSNHGHAHAQKHGRIALECTWT